MVSTNSNQDRPELNRTSQHELITGVDLFFSVQIFFNIEGVFGVVVGGQLVVGMLGQVVLVRKKWSDTTQLQNALAAVQHRQQLLPGAASIRQL